MERCDRFYEAVMPRCFGGAKKSKGKTVLAWIAFPVTGPLAIAFLTFVPLIAGIFSDNWDPSRRGPV